MKLNKVEVWRIDQHGRRMLADYKIEGGERIGVAMDGGLLGITVEEGSKLAEDQWSMILNCDI